MCWGVSTFQITPFEPEHHRESLHELAWSSPHVHDGGSNACACGEPVTQPAAFGRVNELRTESVDPA